MLWEEIYRHLKPILWLLPGFLLYAAFPPMGERMDCLFALAPLMWLCRREANVRLVARRWFVAGFVFWFATLSWMPAIVKNGGPWPLVVLGWGALAMYCAAYFWLYGWLSAKYWRWAKGVGDRAETQRHGGGYGRRLLGILVVEPVLWCGLELVRSRFLGGFSWNQLGVVPVNSGFGAPAALGGVYLCSAVVILINGTIAGIVERVWKPDESGFKNLRRLGTLETLLAFGVVWGVYGLSSSLGSRAVEQSEQSNNLKVAMVQRNFPCCFKAQEANPLAVYGRLAGNFATLRPDLVVLPESALCEVGAVNRQRGVQFARWLSEICGGAAVLAGGTRVDGEAMFNSAAIYAFPSNPLPRVTAPTACYDKVHLVPFGEFIPGDKWFPVLQKLAPVGSCTPGELKTIPFYTCTSGLHLLLGVAICFEDTDSAQMRKLAKKGAQVLCFITNDSWFSRSVEPEQHAWQAVARALETGLPVVRVGNSGVTGTISPDGKASWLLGPDGKPLVDKEGTMLDRVAVCAAPTPTVYTSLGDGPLGIAFALLILLMILVKYKSHYEKRRQLSM